MKFVIFRDGAGEWRWQAVALNNRIVASSGEGYINHGDCVAAIRLLQSYAPTAAVVDA